MKLLSRFWKEEAGVLISLELILAAIMLVFGLVAGMQILRDAAAQELADLGMAIGAINNSFTITGIAGPEVGTGTDVSGTTGSIFTDNTDNGDTAPTVNGNSGGIQLGLAGLGETAS